MKHERAYAISTYLHDLHRRVGGTTIMGFHLYRYKHFVDTSPRRQYCRYAGACIKLHYMDNQKPEIVKFLEALQPAPPQLHRLLETLDEDQDHQ